MQQELFLSKNNRRYDPFDATRLKQRQILQMQELALLQDKSQRRIAILGSRHVPVVAVHLIELVARSLVQEGHSLVTSGYQGVNAAVIL